MTNCLAVMKASLGLRSTYLSAGQITITHPGLFQKVRWFPVVWGNLTVVFSDTELYTKALLFYENPSGNMTALLNRGDTCVDTSSNHGLENGSGFLSI